MDLGLILFIVGVLFVIIMIFKFIKKIVFAILSVVLFLALIVGGIFLLVYLDVSNLSDQTNFDVKIVYGKVDTPIMGVSVPIVEQSLDAFGVKSLEVSTIDEDSLKELGDGEFYIFISEELYTNMLNNKTKYYLQGTEEIIISDIEVDTALSKDQVLELLSSENPLDDYVDIIYSQNDFEFLGTSAKATIKNDIETELSTISINFQEVVFISTLITSISSSENSLKLVEGFKDDELQVYPDKFTFKLVKMLPAKTIQEKLDFSS
ncbi:MAG: hypothetical protein KC550_00490 [Nanoarchaeota archaeon]|nr:hypothetical protein [Nanoarchaeota archaeon]